MSNSSHGKQQPEQNIAGGFGKQQPISLIGSKKSEWSTYSPHQDDGVKTIGTNFFIANIDWEKGRLFGLYYESCQILKLSANFFQVANLEF